MNDLEGLRIVEPTTPPPARSQLQLVDMIVQELNALAGRPFVLSQRCTADTETPWTLHATVRRLRDRATRFGFIRSDDADEAVAWALDRCTISILGRAWTLRELFDEVGIKEAP